MAVKELSPTLEVETENGRVSVTRWPETFGKWSSYLPDAEITLSREEQIALRDYLNTVIEEGGPTES